MEVGKSKTKSQAKSGFLKRTIDFVGEVKLEIQRITWTSKAELAVYTKIVLAATFLLGLGIYLVDLFIRSLLASLSQIVQWIAG